MAPEQMWRLSVADWLLFGIMLCSVYLAYQLWEHGNLLGPSIKS